MDKAELAIEIFPAEKQGESLFYSHFNVSSN